MKQIVLLCVLLLALAGSLAAPAAADQTPPANMDGAGEPSGRIVDMLKAAP